MRYEENEENTGGKIEGMVGLQLGRVMVVVEAELKSSDTKQKLLLAIAAGS